MLIFLSSGQKRKYVRFFLVLRFNKKYNRDIKLYEIFLEEEMILSDRKAALDMALKQIEKQFGKGSVMKLGEQSDRQIDTSSSGSLALDAALGVGGYPRGRIVEIYGPESSGKTTVSLHAIAEIQANGGTAAFIDAEHGMSC